MSEKGLDPQRADAAGPGNRGGTPDMAPHTIRLLTWITTTYQKHIEVLAKVFQKLYYARL